MASSRDVRSPRHAGRVVDPLAREDGVDEPEMSLGATDSGEDPGGELSLPRRVIAEDAKVPDDPDGSAVEGHPVRDRLLARAAAARREQPDQASSTTEDDVLGSMSDELDRVSSRRAAPSAPALAAGRRELPPNVIVLFGTLLGLTLFAALFAVLMHVDPRDGALPAKKAEPPAPPSASASGGSPPVSAEARTVPKPERVRIPGPWRVAESTDPKLRKIEGTIGRDPFLKAIGGAGVPQAQTFRVLLSLKGLRDFDRCSPRDRFSALLDRSSSRVVAFEYMAGKEDVYQAREGPDGLLKGQKLDLRVERTRVQGAIRFDRSTFGASAEAGGFEPSLASVIDDALEGHLSVADMSRGDRLRVVAQEVTVLGEFARYAGVEALELVSVKDPEKRLRIYYFQGSRSKGYYDALGRSVHEGGWRKPIKGAPITSRFNPRRMHPVLKKIMPHQGTDFGAPMGTPVGASGPGTVRFLGYDGASGNLVSLTHTGGIETGYAHLSRFEPGLKVGDRVTAMQVVGYVGSTGRSTGPHLHFSVKKDGAFVDPESLKLDSLRVLPEGERSEFIEARTKLDALLDAIAMPPALAEPAPPPPAPSDLDHEEGPEEEQPGDGAEASGPPTAAEPPAPDPKAKVTPQSGSVYLSDQELQKTQPASDDGEVEE